MRKGQIIALIQSSAAFDGSEVGQLVHLSEMYPYCAVIQKVTLKALAVDEDLRYDERLPFVATVVRNRAKLHDYIFNNLSEGISNNQVGDSILVDDKQTDVVLEEELLVPELNPSVEDYFEEVSSSSVFGGSKSNVLQLAVQGAVNEKDESGAHSFSDWLVVMNKQKTLCTPLSGSPISSSGKWSLIDNFITEQPAIKRSTEISKPIKKVEEFVDVDNEAFITETLARIYVKQKHYEKAVGIFEKLSLKYPEKNTYFAAQIKLIEQSKNNEKE